MGSKLDGMGWDGKRCQWDGMGWDDISKKLNGMGWDGIENRWDGMGWDPFSVPLQVYGLLVFKQHLHLSFSSL